MGLLQRIRDLLPNRKSVSSADEWDASSDPREVERDNAGSGGLYGPIAAPNYVRDE